MLRECISSMSLTAREGFQVIRSEQGIRSRWPQFVAIGLAFAAVVGALWLRAATVPDSAQVVIRFERRGGRAQQDQELIEFLAGSQPADPESAVAAYCVNGWYWAIDDTLNLSVVVGSRDRLIEAAALAESGRHDATLVSAIEAADLNSETGTLVDVSQVPESILTSFGADAVERYLADVSRPPAQESRDRFVVFAVSITTSRQSVFVIDLDHLDTDAIRRFIGHRGFGVTGNDVVVAGRDRTLYVDESDCESLVSE